MKRNITWIAAVIALLVWGRLFYNFFYSDIQELNDVPIENNHAPYKIRKVNKDYELAVNYADPFLKLSKSHQPITASSETPKKTVKGAKPVVIKHSKPIGKLPTLNFMGTLKNHKTGELLAIISIENIEHIMSVGEVVKGIKLNEIVGDSVEVVWQKDSSKFFVSK